MEAMLGMDEHPWEQSLDPVRREFTSIGLDTRLVVGVHSPGLQVKYIIAALYEAGVTIAARRGFEYCKLYVSIILKGRVSGWLLYDKKEAAPQGPAAKGTNLSAAINSTEEDPSPGPTDQSPDTAAPPLSGLSAPPRSGWVHDLNDPKFAAYYECGSRSLAPNTIFTVFLDAIATTAQHAEGAPGAEILALSADRRVEMKIDKAPEFPVLTWGAMRAILGLLWREVVVGYQGREGELWEEMVFLVSYEDERIADGLIAYHDTPVPPT